MKIEELEKEINDIEETLNNLKIKVEELKKNKNSFEPTPKGWRPKDGEKYHFVNIGLRVCESTFDDSSIIDEEIIKYNRIFQSEEECQLYCEIQRAFRDASKEFECEKNNYLLRCYMTEKRLSIIIGGYCKANELYFDSEEIIRNLIDKFGEENVKRYYLNVYD